MSRLTPYPLNFRLRGELQPLFLGDGERLREFLALRREPRRLLRIARESVGRGERLVDAGDQLRELLDACLGGGELAPRLPGVAALRRLLLCAPSCARRDGERAFGSSSRDFESTCRA